jgi:hypothetical protein
VGCIAEQCHTGHAFPSLLDRKRIDRAKHGVRLSAGEKCCQRGSPSVEFRGDAGLGIRILALTMFDAIDADPWVGSALTRSPGQSPMLRIVERIGQQIRALGVPKKNTGLPRPRC